MQFINLTPHELNIHTEDGRVLNIARTAVVGQEDRFYCIRVAETRSNTVVEGINFASVEYGKPYLAIINGKGEEIESLFTLGQEGNNLSDSFKAWKLFQEAIKGCTHTVVSAMLKPFSYEVSAVTNVNTGSILAPGLAVRDNGGKQIGAKGFSVL